MTSVVLAQASGRGYSAGAHAEEPSRILRGVSADSSFVEPDLIDYADATPQQKFFVEPDLIDFADYTPEQWRAGAGAAHTAPAPKSANAHNNALGQPEPILAPQASQEAPESPVLAAPGSAAEAPALGVVLSKGNANNNVA